MEESLPDLKSLLGFDPDEPEDAPPSPAAKSTPPAKKEPAVSKENEEFDLTAFLEDNEDEFFTPAPAKTAPSSHPPIAVDEEEEIVFDWDDDSSSNSRVSSFGTELPADFDEKDEEDWDFGVDEDDEDEEDDDYLESGNALYYPDPSPRVFDDEEDEAPPAEAEEEVKEAPAKKNKKQEASSEEAETPKGGFGKRFKEKFADFKAQAAAELHGEDAAATPPTEKNKGKELAVIEDDKEEADAEEQGEDKGKKAKQGGGKNPLKAIFAPFWKLYLSLVDIIFNILNGVLGFLGKIPILGIPFKFLKQFTKPLKIIATSLPLLLVVGVLVYFNMNAVPKETTTSLPDNGSVVFTDFTYDGEKKVAAGTLKNTGEVIAEGTPVFKLYSMKPGLNPVSWFMPQERITCEAAFVRVDIDKTKKVQANCKGDIPGFQIKTSGELK